MCLEQPLAWPRTLKKGRTSCRNILKKRCLMIRKAFRLGHLNTDIRTPVASEKAADGECFCRVVSNVLIHSNSDCFIMTSITLTL